MGRYKVLEAIGEGSFGKVFRGECRETEQVVALKFIPKHLKGDSELSSLRRECEIQRGLFHPNIVLMLDSFETEREVVAVSEYVPQQLCALLQASGCMAEAVVCSIACNLVSALYYLHSHRIVHRDIKPQNILLTDSGVAKLCDFGFSKKMEINTYVLESIKGTPLYMAPELIEQQPYDQKADLWSLGCILYELLTGKPPFCTNSIVHLIEMVRTKPVQWPSGCSTFCISLLQGLLQKDQDKRLEWPDILQHPWVSRGITVVPHNPRIASLTSPLTQSQQQVKEHQKQQLVLRNMGQPNLLPKAISRKIFNDARVVPDLEAIKQEDNVRTEPTLRSPQNVSHVSNTICSSLEKMSLSNGTTGRGMMHEEHHLMEAPETRPAQMWPAQGGRRVSQVDVTSGVGTGTRTPKKYSRGSDCPVPASPGEESISQAVASANRRDSVSNYLGQSYDGSRTGSRPSNAFPGEFSDRQSATPEKRLQGASEVSKTTEATAEETEIQEDEWIHFLNQTIADVMGGSFDVYTQPGELAMFVAPLRNTSCPLAVTEKIAVLFMLPFVLKPSDTLQTEICEGYLQHKVVSNLIFACKHVRKSPDVCTDGIDLDKDQVGALSQMLLVICHLIHLESPMGSSFLTQLCEGICVLECHAVLGQTLLCPAATSQLLASILAILTQMLRSEESPSGVDLSNVVMLVIASAVPGSGQTSVASTAVDQKTLENSLRFLLMSLLTHTAHLVRSRTSSFLAHATSRRAALVDSALTGQHKLLCDLINLENDPSREVCRAASFALSRLQQHTALLKHPV